MEIALINDQILPLTEVPAGLLDRGIFFGDGVYEVLRSYHGKIFALDRHLDRFERSLKEIRISRVDIPEIRRRILDAFEQAGFDDAKIYFHITRGAGPRNHLPGPNLKPSFFLTIEQIIEDPQTKQRGIKVCTHPDWRWKRCDIKSLNLLANILARMDADQKGCDEAILVNDKGQITEGAGSAFFAIDGKGKTLSTHPLGPEILPSITRSIILQLAPRVGLTPVEKPLTPEQAAAMDELFLAVTTKDIVPIIEFDDRPIADGQPGEYTKDLMKEFRVFIDEQNGYTDHD